MAALDHVDRLRSEIERLGTGRGLEQQAGQNGRPGNGQPGQGQPGQNGQGQPGQGWAGGRGQQGGQQTNGPQTGQNAGRPGGRGGQEWAGNTGDLGNLQRQGGGAGGVADRNVNTGNNTYSYNGPRVEQGERGSTPVDSERVIRQGIAELNQLRALAKNDPAAMREIQELVKEMQQLDPSRFPGNPAMVEQLHARVLSDIDKLELQLSRSADVPAGQVRTAKAPAVPAGYQDAVADYYLRLGKGQ